MRETSSSRAEALRRLLGLSYEDVAEGINRLAATEYGYSDTYRWFREKTRKPTVALAIYLRMVLKAQWRRRCARRLSSRPPEMGLHERVGKFLAEADPRTIERFEKRLRLSEFDLEALQFNQDA